MAKLSQIHSFESKIRRARAILRQIQLARKMFNSCIKTWENGIKTHSVTHAFPGGSSAVNLYDDVKDRMTQFATFTTDINTAIADLEFELPNKIKPGEPYYFESLAVTASSGAIVATMNITEETSADVAHMKGPFYGLLANDVVRISNSEDAANDGYYAISSVTHTTTGSAVVEATGIVVGAISGGVDNTADTKMTITRVQDYTA